MKRLIMALPVLMLIISSCSNRNLVTLESTTAGDTVDIQQNIEFTFNHDLVPDSMIDRWDSSQFLIIKPDVKGLFKWTARKTLLFSPAAGFLPSTGYVISAGKDLLKFVPTLKTGFQPLKFHTPGLKITGMQSWWTLDPSDPSKLALNITANFNYDVDPSIINSHASMEVNGIKSNAVLVSTNVSQELTWRINALQNPSAATAFRFTLHQGSTCVRCGEANKNPLAWSTEIASPSEVTVMSMEGDFENGESVIRIQTNQPLKLTGIEKHIRVIPEVKFIVEPHESGITLKGTFAAGQDYEITLSHEIEGLLGGHIANDYTETVRFGERSPALAFTNQKGIYLGAKSAGNIGINITNIPKVRVTVFKVYENNILSFLNNNRYEDWEAEGQSWNYNDYNLEQYGNEIFNQLYETKNLPRQNGISLLNMNLEDKLAFKGIYLLSIQSEQNQWQKITKLISISDIGLIARASSDEVVVFTSSLQSAKSTSGIKISVISTNNQVLYTGVTNGDGVVKFSGMSTSFGNFTPGLITARNGDDFNYMQLQDARLETSRFETGGYRDNASGYSAFIYGDREIYRPGDTIHTNIIVRNKQWMAVASVPVKVKLIQPNGKEFSTLRKTLNNEGATAQDFIIPAAALTGTYTLEILTGNDVLLASKPLSIEEFMPDRISVKINTSKTVYREGDSVVVNGTALNLFGPPAAGRNYECQFSLKRVEFTADKFSDYNFSISGNTNSFPEIFKQGKTSAEGTFSEGFTVSSTLKDNGLLKGTAFITVFDETGRPVNRVQNFDVETQRLYPGIRSSDNYVGVGQPVQFDLIAVDRSGQKQNAAVKMQLIKINYNNIVQNNGGQYRFISQKQEHILQEKNITLTASGYNFSYRPAESGQYVIRLSNSGSERYVEQEFYAYGWGFTNTGAFSVNTEGTIDIQTDKSSYTPGETASLLFKTPFNGRLLVTVERDHVFEYHFLDTERKSAELKVKMTDDHLPTVYITATLYRPLDDGAIPLTVAHGIKPLNVENTRNKIPVEITAVKTSRSNSKQTITVKLQHAGDAEVTVAVVDEGILQLHNTASPDPYKYFYQKRALDVEQYDIFPWLLPDLKIRRTNAGGGYGDGYDMARRINPITNKRVKLVSTWSGVLHANAAGVATYSVNIPQFSGDLRVMAVAYKKNAFGSAQAHIKVADPLVISTALPRFISPSDTVDVPVTLTNTTTAALNVSPSINATGGIKIIASAQSQLSIPANTEQRVMFRLAAPLQAGNASVNVQAIAGSEKFTDKTEITIRPPAGVQVRNGNGVIKGGSTATVDFNAGFIPATADAKLVVSRSPLIAFTDQYNYLISYPHGCAEQIISSAFPQLYYADLIPVLKNTSGTAVNTTYNVQAAIKLIESQQLYNGGISTWQGMNDANWWTTAYAAHFLSEASAAGYEVNKSALDKIYSFLISKINTRSTEKLYYYDAGSTVLKSRMVPPKDIFYSLYVLALNNRADHSVMNYYKSRLKDLAVDSRYLLAASYQLTGDRRSYADVLPSQFGSEHAARSDDGNFYSYIRDQALALNALLTVDPDNLQVVSLSRSLSEQLTANSWYSTQERAFALLALGKVMKANASSTVKASIKNGDQTTEFTGKDVVLSKNLVNRSVQINSTGNGNLYYFWSTSGVNNTGKIKEEDSQLQVRKSFLNRFGQPLTVTNIRQNDLIVVKITLQSQGGATVNNIAVTDLLPAGFEIENPRVASVPELSWIKDESTPVYLDVRDDRINLYTDAGPKPKIFYYLVRAVSTGNYVLGPVSADAMYNGAYHSMSGSGRVVIR